jgi:hypothetical protein
MLLGEDSMTVLHYRRVHPQGGAQDRSLFGKYHQLVWQPSIIRGTQGNQAPAREIEVRV